MKYLICAVLLFTAGCDTYDDSVYGDQFEVVGVRTRDDGTYLYYIEDGGQEIHNAKSAADGGFFLISRKVYHVGEKLTLELVEDEE